MCFPVNFAKLLRTPPVAAYDFIELKYCRLLDTCIRYFGVVLRALHKTGCTIIVLWLLFEFRKINRSNRPVVFWKTTSLKILGNFLVKHLWWIAFYGKVPGCRHALLLYGGSFPGNCLQVFQNSCRVGHLWPALSFIKSVCLDCVWKVLQKLRVGI